MGHAQRRPRRSPRRDRRRRLPAAGRGRRSTKAEAITSARRDPGVPGHYADHRERSTKAEAITSARLRVRRKPARPSPSRSTKAEAITSARLDPRDNVVRCATQPLNEGRGDHLGETTWKGSGSRSGRSSAQRRPRRSPRRDTSVASKNIAGLIFAQRRPRRSPRRDALEIGGDVVEAVRRSTKAEAITSARP